MPESFIGIGDERDPIIERQEEEAVFTIPREPVRRGVHGIETFNVLRGGEYFFMPSLSALRWLGSFETRSWMQRAGLKAGPHLFGW